MHTVFGPDYAHLYDYLYSKHDFAVDAKIIENTILRHIHNDNRKYSILDIGCGTGSHTAILKNDYNVVGVDRSAEMLVIARQKSPDVVFHQADMATFDLNRKFDVALMMSAVLGYQYTNDDVLKTLRNVRKHIVDGGLLIFDVWHGPSVLFDKPKEQIREISTPSIQLLRVVKPQLHIEFNRCMCNYTWWCFINGKMMSGKESHIVRYFFPMEMRLFFALSGFELIRIGKSGTLFCDPDVTCRDAIYVCKAV